VIEILNQLVTYIGKKEFKKNFWEQDFFHKLMMQKWKKWQNVWKNSILHYTPRVKPHHDDVRIDGIIEAWLKKKHAQHKSINLPRWLDLT
jgi:hypothetical protein